MALSALKKLAGWNGDAVPWPDEVSPELVKARGDLAAAKDKFAELGPKIAEAHRTVMEINDAPYIDLSAPDGAERMAQRRQEYAAWQRKYNDLAAERRSLKARSDELEPQVQQLATEASHTIVEHVRDRHAEFVRRTFLGAILPIADSIAAQVELSSLVGELERRDVRWGRLPPMPIPGLSDRYEIHRQQAAELVTAGVLKATDLPPQLAKAWRLA